MSSRPLLLFALLPMIAVAQSTAPSVQRTSDEQALRAWQAGNPGSPAPALQADGEGGTKLVWSGGVTLDRYTTSVQSAAGANLTPLVPGEFYRAQLQADLRLQHADATTDSFIFAGTRTNDPSVLRNGPMQVGSLQLGHASDVFTLMAGDTAANFSPLSSAVGLRGVLATLATPVGSLTGFSGAVVESWEALRDFPERTQPWRDVQGIKLDAPVTGALRAFLTSQRFEDRGRSTQAGIAQSLPDSSGNALTAGLEYKGERLQLLAEAAASRHEGIGAPISGRAGVIDATWRADAFTLRGGAHGLSTGYTSLATGLRPGLTEVYAALDDPVAPWLTLGADVRTSRQEGSVNGSADGQISRTNAISVNATANFQAVVPGLTLGVQRTSSSTDAAGAQRSHNDEVSLSVNYTSPEWVLGATRALRSVENSTVSTGNSVSRVFSWNARRIAAASASWKGSIGLTGKREAQSLGSSDKASATDAAFQLSIEQPGRMTLSVSAVYGGISKSLFAPLVRTRGAQAELAIQLRPPQQIKLYVRDEHRNFNDPGLQVIVRSAGLQYSTNL